MSVSKRWPFSTIPLRALTSVNSGNSGSSWIGCGFWITAATGTSFSSGTRTFSSTLAGTARPTPERRWWHKWEHEWVSYIKHRCSIKRGKTYSPGAGAERPEPPVFQSTSIAPELESHRGLTWKYTAKTIHFPKLKALILVISSNMYKVLTFLWSTVQPGSMAH